MKQHPTEDTLNSLSHRNQKCWISQKIDLIEQKQDHFWNQHPQISLKPFLTFGTKNCVGQCYLSPPLLPRGIQVQALDIQHSVLQRYEIHLAVCKRGVHTLGVCLNEADKRKLHSAAVHQ